MQLQLGFLVRPGKHVFLAEDFKQIVQEDTISKVGLEVVDAQRALSEVIVAPTGEGLWITPLSTRRKGRGVCGAMNEQSAENSAPSSGCEPTQARHQT